MTRRQLRRSVRVFLAGRRLPAISVLPAAAARFIRSFDAGCYPNLIDGLGALDRGYLPGVGGAATDAWRGDSEGLDLLS